MKKRCFTLGHAASLSTWLLIGEYNNNNFSKDYTMPKSDKNSSKFTKTEQVDWKNNCPSLHWLKVDIGKLRLRTISTSRPHVSAQV